MLFMLGLFACQWRSSFPFPSCLLRLSYSLPSFAKFPRKSKDLCTLEKIPLFLFRVRAHAALPYDFFFGDESEDHMELPSPLQCSVKEKIPVFLLKLRGMAAAAAYAAVSPSQYLLGRISQDDHIDLASPPDLQCSVKVKILGSDPTLMNMRDCQIFPLDYQYRIIGWDLEDRTTAYRGVAVLQLNKKGGGGGFVMLLNFSRSLLVLRSAEMRWKRLENVPNTLCEDLVTYRGRFYAVFNGDVFVIDPFSLEATPLIPLQPLISQKHLVPSGNDELFLVERIILLSECWSPVIVTRLDEEAGKWIEVTDLGDRILFIGKMGNVSCSAKELPHGCGLSGDSILFTNVPGNVTNPCKYGVHLRREKCWRL